jgi:hypothetical protein
VYKPPIGRFFYTDGEAAIVAVSYVLIRDVDISGHDNHKERGYPAFTCATPVVRKFTLSLRA